VNSQKAANLERDDRVSLAIDHDTLQAMELNGLSMAARAHMVDNPTEVNQVLRMLPLKYPEQVPLPLQLPNSEQVRLFRIFRVTPTVIPCSAIPRVSDTPSSQPAERLLWHRSRWQP